MLTCRNINGIVSIDFLMNDDLMKKKGKEAMNQKNLAKYLQIITIGVAILGIIICFGVVPLLGKELIGQKGEGYMDWYLPWMILCWVLAVPCYLVLYHFWEITKEIKKDNSFSNENAIHLKKISHLFVADIFLLVVGNIVYLALGWNQLGCFIMCMIIACAGLVLSVLSAALSHLVYKAVALKEENDLTI